MYDQQYLENLIRDKVEENLNLDYKAADALEHNDKKTSEISKDVSSFMNADGGLIIYGMKEDPINKHLPHSIDPINRKQISKEWLEQIITGKIRPMLDNLSITPIEIDNDVNKVVYVVEIPKGLTAHQAEDKKYYRRYNFMSVPMHDYEIRDIFNRRENTKLVIGGVKGNITGGSIFAQTQLKFAKCSLEIQIENIGNAIENQYKLHVYLPSTIRRGNVGMVRENFIRAEEDYDLFSFPNTSPLFQHESTTVVINGFELSEGMNILDFNKLKIKLYYTNGLLEKEYDLWRELMYRTKTLKDWGW